MAMPRNNPKDRLEVLYQKALLKNDMVTANRLKDVIALYGDLKSLPDNIILALRLLAGVIFRCRNSHDQVRKDIGVQLEFLKFQIHERYFSMKIRRPKNSKVTIHRGTSAGAILSSGVNMVIKHPNGDVTLDVDAKPVDQQLGEQDGAVVAEPNKADEVASEEKQEGPMPTDDQSNQDAPESGESDGDGDTTDITKMNNRKLKAYATEKGLHFPGNISRDDLIALIQNADQQQQQ